MKYKLFDKVFIQHTAGTVVKLHSDLDIEPVYTVEYDMPLGANTKGMFKESDLKMNSGKENDMKLYCFGLNFDAYKWVKEPYLTEIKIPAENEEMAWLKLDSLVGGKHKREKCWLNEAYDYE
jgi:hypothetical protein